MTNKEMIDYNGSDFISDENGLTQYAPETGVENEGLFRIPGSLGPIAVSKEIEVNVGE